MLLFFFFFSFRVALDMDGMHGYALIVCIGFIFRSLLTCNIECMMVALRFTFRLPSRYHLLV